MKLGRWLNRDPFAENGGLNLNVTLQNDPINNVDFLGLWKINSPWTGDPFNSNYAGTTCAEEGDTQVGFLRLFWGGEPLDAPFPSTAKDGIPVAAGTVVNMAPFLKDFESYLRENIVAAAGEFGAVFPNPGDKFDDGSGHFSAAEIDGYFDGNPVECADCLGAARIVMLKGLKDSMDYSRMARTGVQTMLSALRGLMPSQDTAQREATGRTFTTMRTMAALIKGYVTLTLATKERTSYI